jgi:hypothetical protein
MPTCTLYEEKRTLIEIVGDLRLKNATLEKENARQQLVQIKMMTYMNNLKFLPTAFKKFILRDLANIILENDDPSNAPKEISSTSEISAGSPPRN